MVVNFPIRSVFKHERFNSDIHAGANPTENDPDTPYPVVIDMPEHHGGDMGGTKRLGKRRTVFKTENSVLRKL